MTEADKPFDVDAIVDAMAPLLGLTIAPGHRPDVVTNLKVTVALATLVLEWPLGDHVEQAPVFRA